MGQHYELPRVKVNILGVLVANDAWLGSVPELVRVEGRMDALRPQPPIGAFLY